VSSTAMNRSLRQLSIAALALVVPGVANALSCGVSATAVGFGSYDTLSPLHDDATGTITVTCSNLLSLLVSYDILLSSGGASSYSPRRMASGGHRLDYNLYTNLTRSTIWGDGTGGSSKLSDGYLLGVLVPVVRNYTIFGRIPARQNVAAGSYTDTITVTVNY
jgi:spore coat protein U-like protein